MSVYASLYCKDLSSLASVVGSTSNFNFPINWCTIYLYYNKIGSYTSGYSLGYSSVCYLAIGLCFSRGANVARLKPVAHESYLLSKNSLVSIGVSKFPRVRRRFQSFCSRVPGENGITPRVSRIFSEKQLSGGKIIFPIPNHYFSR